MYEQMFYDALRIRMVEEKIIELYPTDKIQSPVHLSIGQEAVAVGVCQALESTDPIFINYRGHAYYLARKAPLHNFFAELYGKETGLSKGKAGSMHLAAPEFGVMGASAVVGSTISHAVGAALASKLLQNDNRIYVAVYGDGATEQGTYHESLNFAALHQLPVLFLCENNQLAVHAALNERQSFNHHLLVKAYGIDYLKIDEGYDWMKIFSVTSAAVAKMREKKAPLVLEVATCRYKEHVGPGEDLDVGYRSKEDILLWKEKDPLISCSDLVEQFARKINDEIQAAVDFAERSSYPHISELLTDVI